MASQLQSRSQSQCLHVLFFPLMAPGHILPMLHLAKLFAARRARATLLTTPANYRLLQPAVDGVSINLRLIDFPSAAVGLPPGRESLDSVDFRQHSAFLEGVYMLEDQFRCVLAELRPDAVVSDWFLPWTFAVAEEFHIPRLAFHGYGAFALCANASFLYAQPPPMPRPGDEGSTSFVIPGFPRRLEMATSQLPDLSKLEPVAVKIFQQIAEWETRSFGVVVNSFYELETEFADHLRSAIWRRAWLIGPAAPAPSFCHNGDDLSVSRWLDEQQDASVLYVCFGSVSSIGGAQLQELALGLEASGHNFIWVVRTDDAAESSWRPAGLADRTKQKRWLIIEGWAPQAAILGHVAVGGFVTHCGWSSCMEAVTTGVPMATWPLFAEQFLNERLVTEVLGVGVSVGATHWTMDPEERPLIPAAEVERAARRVMDAGGEEGRRMRTKARELALAAKRATAEGGSSFEDMDKLIKDLIDQKNKK